MRRHLHAFLLAFLFVLSISTANADVATTYFHNDISGSPMVATDAVGNVVWKESYRPYGDKLRNEPASRNDTNKIGYAGSPFDASTGLSYMGARYYDPQIGRFMGIDPVGFQEDNIHSFNRYAYANNNPYRYIDRDGRQSTDILYNVWNRAFGNSAGPNANGAMGLEVAKQGLVQGYFDGMKMSAEVGLTVSSLGLGGVGSIVAAESGGANILIRKIIAKDGTEITGFTKHGVDRAVGDGGKRAGTKPQAILDALRNPKSIKEGVDDLDRPFKTFKGENARVVTNPETGNIVSTNPTSRVGAN